MDWYQGYEILVALRVPDEMKVFNEPRLIELMSAGPSGAMSNSIVLGYIYHWREPVTR